MRLYFDRNFRFGGYSTSAEEFGNEATKFGLEYLLLFLVIIIGPFSGLVGLWLTDSYNKAVEEENDRIKKSKTKGKKQYHQKAPAIAWILSVLFIIIGSFLWMIIANDLMN